jgi:hypothetical protein
MKSSMRKSNGNRTKRFKPIVPLEIEEQAVLVQWRDLHPDPRVHTLFHIPNETAWKLQGMGTIAGVSDFFLPVMARGYGGLWLELKRQSGGVVSEEQRQWLDTMALYGYACAISQGADEAIADITWYLDL